jgi:hypothetical protein
MYQMHRIFCASPWEMEREQILFNNAVGKFNGEAMAKGVLFVPVALTNIRDKRPLQYTVDENIRECSYFVLLLGGDWGPVERNLRCDYELALECLADPALPMQDVVVLKKMKSASGASVAHDLPAPRATFYTPGEFADALNGLFAAWLE